MFSSPTRAVKLLFQAVIACFKSLPLVATISLLAGGLLGWGEKAIFLNATAEAAATGGDPMIPMILGWVGLSLAFEVIAGPFLGALAVYVALRHVGGTRQGFAGGLRFAASRYARLFLPHLLAQLAIQFGMQVILPGILFWTMYAFVDTIACLEPTRQVLSRSAALTKGRRLTVVFILIPFIALGLVRMFMDLDLVETLELPAFIAWTSSQYLLGFLVLVAQSLLYVERMGGIEAIQANSKANESPAAPTASPASP